MRKKIFNVTVVLSLLLCLIILSFFSGVYYNKTTTEPQIITKEVIKEVTTTVYRLPTSMPYTSFSEPISLEDAMSLLYGMKVSHEQALKWTFEGNPGFGIADRDFQNQCILWYNQLMDFVQKQNNKIVELGITK